MLPPHPSSTLFPYTTLFRSWPPVKCPEIILAFFASKFGQTESGAKKRSEEHTSELQSRGHLVCRLLLEKKKYKTAQRHLPSSSRYQLRTCLRSLRCFKTDEP